MNRHAAEAVAELHAARLSMQNAYLALYRATRAGEPISDRDLRTLHADLGGAGEEAAAFAALLSGARTGHRVARNR